MEQHPPQGGDLQSALDHPRWPKYLGALALDSWLTRVAEYDDQEPSVELYIAQYPGDEVEQPPVGTAEPIKPATFQPIPIRPLSVRLM